MDSAAIKVLPAELAQDAERRARFEREARLLASLNHPNIAHVYGSSGRCSTTAPSCIPWRWSWSRATASRSG